LQFAHLNGVTIHYQVIGAAGKPLIVFANSLGTDFRIWRDVIVRLVGDYAVICYDKRGHGLSSIRFRAALDRDSTPMISRR
jgi:3-oxoadipate enol-lactonase